MLGAAASGRAAARIALGAARVGERGGGDRGRTGRRALKVPRAAAPPAKERCTPPLPAGLCLNS